MHVNLKRFKKSQLLSLWVDAICQNCTGLPGAMQLGDKKHADFQSDLRASVCIAFDDTLSAGLNRRV